MTMRFAALAALPFLALVGCGVPEHPPIVAKTEEPATKPKVDTPPKKDDPKPDPTVKPAEQDPAKLGETVVDTVVGTGAVAEPGDTCSMRYAGRLKANNQEFDSNMVGGKPPFSFVLGSGQVIKGWDIGVKGMKAGGKRTLTIPSNLGYGAHGGGDKIPPNADLVFDIELLDVQKAADAATVLRETLAPGTGPAVKNGDIVSITYKAKTSDGTVVDDQSAKPIQFKVGAPEVAVKGLSIALVGMKKGQKVVATIPPALGIPPGPASAKIPPNSTLKFEITLVSVG